ncbi:MAG: HEAT repeat domain-containing protein [Deltaproteobacteria bacterium]|nr:HEAT repeat domain-containing protein [Deltaproteobacteria bacterium]
MHEEIDQKLADIFDADRKLRAAQEHFLGHGDERGRVEALGRALDAASKAAEEDLDAQDRLVRVAELLTDHPSASACWLLLRLLDHAEPAVRAAAGEGLLEIGQTRYADVARTFEKAIDQGSQHTALMELPFLLAELGDAGGVKLCTRLLKHPVADVVAAAVEALASLGDPSSVKDLERLKGDRRKVSAEDEADGAELTLGELVSEALAHLRGLHG